MTGQTFMKDSIRILDYLVYRSNYLPLTNKLQLKYHYFKPVNIIKTLRQKQEEADLIYALKNIQLHLH
jgi:hypothetical protein